MTTTKKCLFRTFFHPILNIYVLTNLTREISTIPHEKKNVATNSFHLPFIAQQSSIFQREISAGKFFHFFLYYYCWYVFECIFYRTLFKWVKQAELRVKKKCWSFCLKLKSPIIGNIYTLFIIFTFALFALLL